MRLVKKHFQWFCKRVARDRIDSSAAHSSFYLIISFLPFLALLLTLMQRVHLADGISAIETVLDLAPERVSAVVRELIPGPLDSSGLVPIAIIMAAWSSSMGMVAVIKGLDQIYEVKKRRGYVHNRLLGFVYVLLLAAVILITAALLVFGRTIYNYLLRRSSAFFARLLIDFKSLVGFALLIAFFTLLYTFLPRRRVKFIHNLAGAAFSAAGWVLFSFFFSLFVENFSNFSIYGSLATLVILMYWLFSCMYILFLGAEVSMWLETSGVQRDLRAAWKRRRQRKERQARDQAAPAEELDQGLEKGDSVP